MSLDFSFRNPSNNDGIQGDVRVEQGEEEGREEGREEWIRELLFTTEQNNSYKQVNKTLK